MHDQLTWAQAAFGRALRPLVRLALGLGLKHSHLEELLRQQLLLEATQLWRDKGVAHPNISQLAITTGLNRKEVTNRVRAPVDPLPHSEMSSSVKTLTLWLQRASELPELKHLPITSGSGGPSFEDIAREASRGDVHHRSVLDELTRLGLCNERDGYVDLAADGYIPTGDLQGTLAFLGDNLRDHAAAAVSNTLAEAPLMLERAVFAGGLTPADCDALHQLARERWMVMHRQMVSAMNVAVEQSQGKGSRRIRVGVYVYHGENDEGDQ
jgi:hypothetical protein